MGLNSFFSNRSGAGYSIEAILASLILFVFAMNAVQVPDFEGWSDFQREIAAKDISYTLKETGDLEQFLKNSDTGALRTTASSLSDVDASLSGTVEGLPINEIQVGFHNTPETIHWEDTVPVQEDDPCAGDIGVIEDSSESEIRRTVNGTGTLEDKYGVRLYFADQDPSIPDGFDGETNYDSIYVDNGTQCIFRNEDGPYYMEDIFYWGNKSDDNPSGFYEFKDYDNEDDRVNLFEADRAVRFGQILDRPINGIETDTSIETFNFTVGRLSDIDVAVFSGAESLDRIEENEEAFREYMGDGSALFLMNLTEDDVERPIVQDIGFQWMDLPVGDEDDYSAAFSSFTESEQLETFYAGYGADSDDISLAPGGKVVSGQGDTETSEDDLLFARNARYEVEQFNGTIETGESWTEINSGEACEDREASFDFHGESKEVRNIDLAESGPECGEIRALKVEQDGEFSEPILENEVYVIDGRRYTPQIEDSEDAEFVFAGSDRVELINHRRDFEDLEGQKIARAMEREEFSEDDRELLVSLIYWLRGDEVRFEGGTGTTSLSTSVYGGIDEEVYMPYSVKLRWGE